MFGALEAGCPEEQRQVWGVRWSQIGVLGARTQVLMLWATFCQMPPWVVGSYSPNYAGDLGWEGPKATPSGTFHKQITHKNQATGPKEDPLRATQVFLAWSEQSQI